MQKRFAVLGALVCALSLFASERAEAAYTFTTSLSLSNPSSGTNITGLVASNGGVTVTFSNQTSPTPSPSVPGASTFNFGDYIVTATNTAAAPANFSFNISDTVTITNAPPPGSLTPTGTLALAGTVTLSNYSATTGTFSIVPLTVTTSTTTAGGNTFVMSNPTFSNPTTGSNGGNVGAQINASSAVPAPASLVMFGLGMGSLGLVRLRRRFSAA